MVKNQKMRFAVLGMMMGVVLGGGIGVVPFSIPGQAVYIAIAGLGAGMGLALGAGMDQARTQ